MLAIDLSAVGSRRIPTHPRALAAEVTGEASGSNGSGYLPSNMEAYVTSKSKGQMGTEPISNSS